MQTRGSEEPPGLIYGEAGQSAEGEYRRRREARERRIDGSCGRLGWVVKRLWPEGQSTIAWARGAEGERRVAGRLERALGDRARLLYDRAVPRSRANIDIIAVASSGVWVIDAKNYRGLVARRDVGGWFRSDERLFVAGRDRTALIGELGFQRDAVAAALGTRTPSRSTSPCASSHPSGASSPSPSSCAASGSRGQWPSPAWWGHRGHSARKLRTTWYAGWRAASPQDRNRGRRPSARRVGWSSDPRAPGGRPWEWSVHPPGKIAPGGVVYFDSGRLVLSPSDLVGHLYCGHLTELSLRVASGEHPAPDGDDPELAVVQRRGIQHERDYLDALIASGRSVTEIPDDHNLATRVAATASALASGPDVIYQATFFDVTDGGPAWRGHADFLERVDGPSKLGPFHYVPSDTKLARHVRPSAVLQLCAYAEQLERVQGIAPEYVSVVLGGRDVVSLRLADFAAYYRATKRRFEEAVAGAVDSYPLPNQHCGVCAWRTTCERRWQADDHLVRVAGLRVDQLRRFHAVGVKTSRQLVALEPPTVRGIGNATVEKLRQQARLQLESARSPGPPRFELLATGEPGVGLGGLPAPSIGDLFFDIEGDPFVDDGLEYLLGVGWVEPEGTFGFRSFWAHSRAEEKASFEAFVDFVMDRLAADPALHVYHYAPYETTALGKLMGRHGTREREIDRLLRGGVFVDLLRVVRQGLRVGTPSYSLKKIEALYMGPRTEEITDAGSSIVEYERWLETGDPAILAAIEAYNRVDCDSTRLLRDWLEARRPEYAACFGTEPSRPVPADGAPAEGVEAESTEHDALRDALAAGAAAESSGAEACRLLGELLEWHRREDKPEWWRFFSRVQDMDDDLFDDTEAIARLEYLGPGDRVKRSVVHRYRFDPSQEHKLSVGQSVVDPASERQRLAGASVPGAGTVVSLDPTEGLLGLKRKIGSSAPHPRNLIPGGPLPTNDQRDALRRVARAVIDVGMDGDGPYRAARDLLLRRPPRRSGAGGELVAHGEDPAVAAVRVAGELRHGCLAIQGPPGSGKTRTAAAIAVDLLARGRRVGVTANSHAVICNLLEAIVDRARDAGVAVSCSQKADGDQALSDPLVTVRASASQVAADLAAGANLVAGTAWLFCRPTFDGTLDFLIVDEAGQLSLANAVALGTCADNLVLVGDPRQLAQPSRGVHPDGAGASALEHVLGGAETMPEHLGLFLDHSHRLHPDVCAFVSEIAYGGRLQAAPGCERQHITGGGPLGGAGLRWAAVDHQGNRASSPEEAAVVAAFYGDLVGRAFVDRDGAERPIGIEEILVVAPYNAQVALLRHALPDGARVGTVDRFQGQQAPAVLVSLATSSVEEIPRGMEFLYSTNRLNVAVSRAQALTVLVASPALLAVRCNTVGQLRLANGLCRFVEMATPIAT